MQEESLEQVQSKIAHLELAMAELSDVVFTQYKQIQALEAQLTSVRDRLESVLPAETRGLDQERPPHY
jgi:uncharacterized coiled-coil protein SlyX